MKKDIQVLLKKIHNTLISEKNLPCSNESSFKLYNFLIISLQRDNVWAILLERKMVKRFEWSSVFFTDERQARRESRARRRVEKGCVDKSNARTRHVNSRGWYRCWTVINSEGLVCSLLRLKFGKSVCVVIYIGGPRSAAGCRLCVKSVGRCAARKFVPIILSSSNLRTATASVHLSPATAPADPTLTPPAAHRHAVSSYQLQRHAASLRPAN